MRENNEDNENIIDTSEKPNIIGNEQNYDTIGKKQIDSQEAIQNGAKRMTSFELELMNAVKKEEEELKRKKDLDELRKIKKRIKLYNTKDYLFFFMLLMSSTFNFSYLYLVNIVLASIYIFFIEKLNVKAMKVKYLCEVFSCGYSSYSLIFKLICLILISNNNESLTKNKSFYIDLGVCYLKESDLKNLNFIMTFLPEVFVVIVSGYSILVSFFCRTFEENDNKYKEIKMLTLRKTILLAYCIVVIYSLFNISFISLLYIILIQFVLLLNSIRITDKNVKCFYHFIVYFGIISLFIQIDLINILNIPSFKSILNQDSDDETKLNATNVTDQKIYSIFTQIGIKYAREDSGINVFLTFISYFMGVSLLITFIFVHIELKSGLNIKTEEEIVKIKKMQEMTNIDKSGNNGNMENKQNGNNVIDNSKLTKNKLDNNNNLKDKKKEKNTKFCLSFINFIKELPKKINVLACINVIYRFLNFLMEHPNFNYEMERIISILWTYYYRNYYSLGMYLVLFCSFFFGDLIKNKFLILFILTPILLITIGSFHISNIDGIIEDLSDDNKVFYSKFAIRKYKYLYLEHIIGHVYYLTVIFLIYTFYSREKTKKKYDKNLNIKNNELLEDIIPKNEDKKKGRPTIIEDDLYENKSDESESDDSDDDFMEKENIPKVKFVEQKKTIKSFSLMRLLIKQFFSHMDKITLIIIYFVALNKINITHVILVLIFVLQIIIPKQIKYIYKILIIFFQIVFLVEFVIDLLKNETINEYKDKIELFIIYTDLNTCDIEIFLYAVIYCFYFQHTTNKLKYIKTILDDGSITFENYVNIKLNNLPILKEIVKFIASVIAHTFFWCLIYFFIYFSFAYEVNLIFGIKLIIFLISLYFFLLTTHKKTMDTSFKMSCPKFYKAFNLIFLIFCSLNTFLAFLYQFLCILYYKFYENDNNNNPNKNTSNNNGNPFAENNNDNFFIVNLPNIGFTLYKESNLYYNFIPHFLTAFISSLYIYLSEQTISNLDIELSKSKTRLLQEKKTLKKSEKLSDEKYKNIKEEKNEFLQDKMYADKYYENEQSIKAKSKRLIRFYIIFLYTKVYWLLLFMSLSIIFSSYDLSFSILFYIIIFGCLFIKKFYKIISKMTRYLSTNSYYISKVIRYSVVEKPLHYELNKYYRSLTFKCCLFLSFLYLILLYFYAIFDLFQHGCEESLYRGCGKSHKSIITPDEETNTEHNSLEAKIKAIALLIGIYINMRKEYIMKVALVHLVLSGLIIFDIYNQQIEEHYSLICNDLQKKLQKQINENNVLEKYSEIADYNILIKIGLTLAGIDMSSSENKHKNGGNMRSNFRMSLKDKFLIKTDSDKDILKVIEESQKQEKEKDNEVEYNLDEDAPENSFLKTQRVRKFIKMIKNSSENEQKLSSINSKGKIIVFFKKFFEEVIIFLLICISLGKLNIWTFIYLMITFYLIASKRTMFKFYVLFCFIYVAILIQCSLYLSNLTASTSIRDFDEIFIILKQTFNIPWYKDYLSIKNGFFFGLGVIDSQVKLITLEFFQIIVIYFYLDLFSYSIYQETLNKGEKSLQGQKFDFHTLNLNQYIIEYIQRMPEVEFQEIRECLECFNFKIGKNHKDFLKILNLKEEDEPQGVTNYSKDDQRNKFDFSGIKNSTLKEVIYFRMLSKELRKTMEKKTNTQYKQYPPIFLVFQEILFMYLHFFLLIFIIITSIMIAGLISICYISFSFYYLIKSDSLFLGIKYTYPKILKKILMFVILFDIIFQGIYSTPYICQEKGSLGYKIFNSIGLIKVINFNEINTTSNVNKTVNDTINDTISDNPNETLYETLYATLNSTANEQIEIDQKVEVFGKAFIYLLMSLQLLIYESKSFKKYYLVYLLSHKNESKKSSIINSFTFNNKRVQIFGKSLSLRQQSDEAMEDLKNLINELNGKLNKIGKSLLTKKTLTKEKPLEYINRVNSEISRKNNKDYNSYNLFGNKNENMNEIIEEDKKNGLLDKLKKGKESNNSPYLEPSEVEQRIRDIIYKGYLINIYSWFHKQSVSYKNLDENERVDFDIETIQGEVKIKSIIENKLNLVLKILDLNNIDKTKMKEIELIIEANFDKNKKKLLEEEKKRKELSRNAKAKLKRAFKFARLVSKKYPDKTLKEINTEGDEISKFKIRQKAEKDLEEKRELEDRKKAEKEEYILKQFEEVLETKLFKKYLTKMYFIQYIIIYLQTFFINNFNAVCYFVMILDHMISSSVITLIYPLSIFCYALLEYPRPKKIYWILVLYYTFIIISSKFILQLKIILVILKEDIYKSLIDNLYNNRIGYKYYDSSFSPEFMKYIFFDALIIICVLINRNLLISDGLWFKREEEVETIYEASERITIYGKKKYSSKMNAIKDLLFKYLINPREMLSLRKKSDADNKELKDAKHKFPFLLKRNLEKPYNEAERGYFERMFTKNRNEKPGNDFYAIYTLVMALICIYILFFYTNMDQDKTYGPISMDMTQFSGSMVLFLILHIIILVYDRIIFVLQNREEISYEYIFYKKNPETGQGELLTEVENNQLKSEICKNITQDKFTIIPQKEIEKLKVYYNILFIQKESFNKPLLNKYILHIFTVLLSHIMIFFYFPIKGNKNLGVGSYCTKDDLCNDFKNNYVLIIFYLLYLLYLILSGLQVKYGFYDIKRKSFFKRKGDEILSGLSKGFNAIPFLYEIKNAIDWTFTGTCLTLFQWNKFEAIYDTIFDTYCEKNDWDERPIGRRISYKKKFGIGATLAFVLILTLIVPLILFSSLNPTNHLNNITAGQLKIDLSFTYKNGAIKNYNLFENTRADSISEMINQEEIWKKYNYSNSAQTRNFNKNQTQRVIFSETSDRNWDLANPHIMNLIKLLNLTEDNSLSQIDITIYFEFTRPLPAETQTVSKSFEVPIYSSEDDKEDSSGAKKLKILRNALKDCTNDSIILENAYSLPLRLTSGSDITEIEDKNYFFKKSAQLGFQGCFIDNNKNKTNYFNSYFTFKSFNSETNQTESVEFHTFSDPISETTSGYSVLTFYVSFVLLVGSYVKEFMESEPEKIMLEEMPHPKKIVELCEGIKIARYSYDFRNEEYLYTVLIELLRSPDYLKLITDSSLDHFKLREELTMQEKE